MTPIVDCRELSYKFGKITALDDISITIPRGKLTGIIGPDGVGKSTFLSLITGSRAMQRGSLLVAGGDIGNRNFRNGILPQIAYMPQGLGKNLYFSLTIEENLQFFARLFGHGKAERRSRIDRLTSRTGLYPFLNRPVGKLSGGMKQKVGLCCALIHDPELLVLDEPTTGVDPLSRRQFWDLIDDIRSSEENMSVVVATAYMDEAERFDHLIAMDDGKILAAAPPDELLKQTGKNDLDAAFIELLPENKRSGHKEITIPALEVSGDDFAIEASGLTKKFGSFTAVDHVSFQIRRGEIFGFLGSNGCGKTTTMRMLTGLLPITEGTASLFGEPVTGNSLEIRKKLGYMTQLFSLYNELTVRQNLQLFARLYGVEDALIGEKVSAMLDRFDLNDVASLTPEDLPLGIKQRLSLAAAVIHGPQILILDEPTSGVDPVARDSFWELIIELSRKDKVTIFITTHFMNEAARCDRISLMHAGKSLICDTPENIAAGNSLEAEFIRHLEAAQGDDGLAKAPLEEEKMISGEKHAGNSGANRFFSFRRWFSCCQRENTELLRDPIRATLALFGALILMVVMGYGISMDVEDLTFAVLDNDNTQLSRNYAMNIAGSRYFKEKAPVKTYSELDRRMRSGELSMVIELPPKFGQKLEKGDVPEIGVWVDGAMPTRSETINGYIKSMHQLWQENYARQQGSVTAADGADIEIRYRYNPDVRSLPAMVPAVIPILLMMIPAILSALSVVREKEKGSIINLYVTPMSRFEFVTGKQFPYIVFSMVSAVLMVIMAVLLFDVPIKGSVTLLFLSLMIYCVVSTGMGLIASSVTRSQIAVIFLTMIGTMLPATQLCGLINPVSAQDGISFFIGSIYPTTYMLLICRGVFNKALGFAQLGFCVYILLAMVPVMTAAGVLLQKKQEK